jgi:transcriptional regulator with XRE-family HTH domain
LDITKQKGGKVKMSKNIGERLRGLRKTAGMTQMGLADKVGVSYQQIQKYEKGTSKLSVPRLMQLADIFGIPFTAIIEDGPKSTGNVVASNFSQEEIDLVLQFRRVSSGILRASIINLVIASVRALNNKARN